MPCRVEIFLFSGGGEVVSEITKSPTYFLANTRLLFLNSGSWGWGTAKRANPLDCPKQESETVRLSITPAIFNQPSGPGMDQALWFTK